MRENIQDAEIKNVKFYNQLMANTRTITLAANLVLVATDAPVQMIDPAGARDVTLPALQDGLIFFITNMADAAEVITIKTAAGVAVCTPTTLESAIVWCNGVTWGGGTLTMA